MNRYDHIYKRVAKELGYPVEVVKLVYSSAWDFVQKNVDRIGIHYGLTFSEYRSMRTSFFYPYLGRLMIDYRKIKSWRRHEVWKKYNLKDAGDKEDKTVIHVDSDDNG